MTTASARTRLMLFLAVAGPALALAIGYVVRARSHDRLAPGAGVDEVARIRSAPHVLFRDLELEPEGTFGHLALTPVEPPSGGERRARTMSVLSCVRVHVGGDRGICLELLDENARKATLRVFGPDLGELWSTPLDGLPSRARVSPDGKLGAVTVFVTGHSYSDGAMSTRTTLLDLQALRVLVADLEELLVTRDGQKLEATGENFWGVTFAPSGPTFHATLGASGKTWLLEGDLASRTLHAVREDVECPSRSPDGSKLAFKKRRVGQDGWRLHVLELATMQERALDEPRSIDDQVEWLDDQRILYKHGANVYALGIAAGSRPEVYLERASSPAVARR
ncbi:MAG: hypothetical protein WKG00_32685 [Polyangiaceae bacterium]